MIGLSVVRDCDFDNLGFLFDDLHRKLVFAEAPRFVLEACQSSGARCVICPAELAPDFSAIPGLAISANPRISFFNVQRWLVQETSFYGVDFDTEVHASARIHRRACIAERNVRIGPQTEIGANAVIEERTTIGSRVRVRAGAVVGSEGFQTARTEKSLIQMVHAGGVHIEDDAEVFANAVIARGVFRQATVVGEGSRVGNGCFISHNVRIGRRCFIGHNSVINGNTTIGNDAWIGPNATVSNLIRIGERASVTLGATVIESVEPDTQVTGVTALPHRRMLRHIASIR
ncbi:MAG TPA: DapH/DapD/GlmU-related protein [Terriglobia bacterium]|nr:DapH/DapD/GlmU-related protein [Terriglobia bacterium]